LFFTFYFFDEMIPDNKTDFLFQPDIMFSIWSSVSIPVMIVRENDLIVLEANPQAKSIFSGICQDLKGKKIGGLGIWPENQDSRNFFRKFDKESRIENFELCLQVEKDRLCDFLISTDTIEVAGIRYRLVMMRDITELKVAEQLTREKENLFEVAVNSLHELVIIHNDGKILFANEIFKRSFGIPGEDCIGRQLEDYIHIPKYNYRSKQSGNIQSVGKKSGLPVEVNLSLPDGSVKYYTYKTLPIKYSDYDVLMSILIDVTERKNLEQAMMGKVLESAERERNLLVKNLHDDLGPDISTIRLLLSSIDQLAKNDEPVAPRLAQCLNYIDDVITKLKSITADISPDLVDRFGLDSSLRALIDKLTTDVLNINVTSNIQNVRFSSKVEINLYRVISELIENTLEHSGASVADLKIKYSCKELSVVYKDNGNGFDVGSISPNDSGSGILNMINRINSLNGKIEFKEYEGQVITVIRINTEPVS
jgi:PAS domain S-box-containing protein